jgi:tetratricopeptide (TPR) repeat protein
VLQFLGVAHAESGDVEASLRALDEALSISRRNCDRYVEASTMLFLARVRIRIGDPDAGALAVAALAIGREYNMPHHTADALGIMGEIELAQGRHAEAIPHLEESVSLWRTRGWPAFLAGALHSLGDAHASSNPQAAQAAWNEARQLFEKLGNNGKVAELTALLAETTGDPRPG